MNPRSVDPELHIFHAPEFESVVHEAIEFLNRTPVHPLPPATTFIGVGVYILYYAGDFKLFCTARLRLRITCVYLLPYRRVHPIE